MADLNKLLSALEKDRAGASTAANDSMKSALEVTHAQELHQQSLAQEQEKLKGLQLKNTAAEQKIEMELVQAQAQGLAPQKDPVIQDPPKQPLPTNQSELLGLVTAKLDSLKQNASPVADEGSIKLNAYVRDELLKSLKALDTEKSLAYSPLGKIGQKLGGLLDIASFGGGFGTAIFGGKMDEASKAEFLSKVMYQTSPLVRSELSDLLARDKMTEKSASGRLQNAGLSGVSSLLKSNSASEADPIIATAIDIKQLVASNVKDSFSGEASIPVGSAFDNWDSAGVAAENIKVAATPEEVAQYLQAAVGHETQLREKIRNFIKNGGTLKQFEAEIGKAQDVVDNRYQKELIALPSDAKGTEFNAMQKVVANDYSNKLDKFRKEVATVFQEEQENAMVEKLGSRKYKQTKALENVNADIGAARKGRRVDIPSLEYKKASPFDLADVADKVVAATTDKKLAEHLDKLDITRDEFAVFKNVVLSQESDEAKWKELKKKLTEYELARKNWKK